MEKVNCSGLFSVTYVVIPQKPLIHPVNDENVFNDLTELLKQVKREYPYLKIKQLN